ncbi:unnamed protein product [Adineta steineri]|uniref:Immunoglobulin I-set domain-containing protein n=1 Tax=Adineta steineri TaxID=433720 RepID=A0A813N7A0_9BILA|nr:unnamed protein product [Adineta steineri]CAF1079059.1 unnamed protein product [Adineta steineri]
MKSQSRSTLEQSTFVEVVVNGNPFPNVIWYKEKIEIAESVKVKTEVDIITGTAGLLIPPCRQTNDSSYAITLQNEHEKAGSGGDDNRSGSRNSIIIDDRQPSLRRVDQENLLKVGRDSKTRRPSLADVISN